MINSKHWVTSKEIYSATGIRPIFIREIINRLRQDGIGIIAGNRGYLLSKSPEQITNQIKSMQGRINQMNKAIKGLKKSIN
jgi:DNA-binding IscR family transcriptional regulator